MYNKLFFITLKKLQNKALQHDVLAPLFYSLYPRQTIEYEYMVYF